jgi:broad specificity phosphatase PhoE
MNFKTMKTIEIRRHSTRLKPGQHLSQSGVSLARLVGESLGPFDRVITSTLPRAFETAIAMGFAVDEQAELISTYGDAVENEIPWPAAFARYAAALHNEGAARQYGQKLVKFYTGLAGSLADGRAALVVNHGGVAEIGAVACLPKADHASWGGPLDVCEGVRLSWDAGECTAAEILRISK